MGWVDVDERQISRTKVVLSGILPFSIESLATSNQHDNKEENSGGELSNKDGLRDGQPIRFSKATVIKNDSEIK